MQWKDETTWECWTVSGKPIPFSQNVCRKVLNFVVEALRSGVLFYEDYYYRSEYKGGVLLFHTR